MSSDEKNTLEKIMTEGKKEFLDRGYKDASLRSIVKQAGVTTGAFYGYFPDKAALFHALASPAAEELRTMYLNAQRTFDILPSERKVSDMHTHTEGHIHQMLDYIYDHFDAFKLIVCRADGTEFQSYVDSLVEIEVESTYQFIQFLKDHGYAVREIQPDLCHMLASACYNGIFETIAHDMSREHAFQHIATLTEFFYAGWDKILGLP